MQQLLEGVQCCFFLHFADAHRGEVYSVVSFFILQMHIEVKTLLEMVNVPHMRHDPHPNIIFVNFPAMEIHI
jgi:hypothetical protein